MRKKKFDFDILIVIHLIFLFLNSLIGTTGPCPAGHLFSIPENSVQTQYATCQCKDGYTGWLDGQCYRLYTRGKK